MTCASCGSSSRRAAQYDAIAELYDGYPGNYLDDLAFFVEEAQRAGSPVLELGVGTGRLALCLAAAGLDVVGLDSSPAMLRVLAAKRARLPALPGRLHALAADMREFSLGLRFPLAIVPFRTFLYLLCRRDQLRALGAIRDHLAPGGRLIMSFFVPPPELIARRQLGRVEMARFQAPGGDGEVVAFDATEFVPAHKRVISHITYEWQDRAGRTTRRLDHDLVARYMFPHEVPPLLARAGYRVVASYGGFGRRPLDDESREQIWVAEPHPPSEVAP